MTQKEMSRRGGLARTKRKLRAVVANLKKARAAKKRNRP